MAFVSLLSLKSLEGLHVYLCLGTRLECVRISLKFSFHEIEVPDSCQIPDIIIKHNC